MKAFYVPYIILYQNTDFTQIYDYLLGDIGAEVWGTNFYNWPCEFSSATSTTNSNPAVNP